MTTTRSVGRDAVTVTTWNLVSRLTGFARVVVVGGALGATRLGDTYQASNQLSNLLFEFIAAGTLSAVLVPGVTARLVGDTPARALAFANVVLGRLLVGLAAIAVAGLALARPLMELLLSGNDTQSRDAQVRLGAVLLLFVMPQLVLYGWGAVTTAVLNAHGRFRSGAAAPVANNLVVIVTMAIVWGRGVRGLELDTVDQMLLGAGALGGVAAMTLVPVVTAARAGIGLRPQLRGSEALDLSLGDVAWATFVVVPVQIFFFVSLLVAGEVPGGVVACQLAFTFFVLPHALLGHPLATVMYPRLARSWATDDSTTLQRDAGRGLHALLVLTAPAAAALVALSPWIVRVVAFGSLDERGGTAAVAAALTGYGAGLVAYSWSLFLSRAAYAVNDVRTPGLAAIVGLVGGLGGLALAAASDGSALIVRVGAAHSAMVAMTTICVLVVLVRRDVVTVDVRAWVPPLLTATAGGVIGRLSADALAPPSGRGGAALAVMVGAMLIAAVHASGLRATGLRWRDLRASLA